VLQHRSSRHAQFSARHAVGAAAQPHQACIESPRARGGSLRFSPREKRKKRSPRAFGDPSTRHHTAEGPDRLGLARRVAGAHCVPPRTEPRAAEQPANGLASAASAANGNQAKADLDRRSKSKIEIEDRNRRSKSKIEDRNRRSKSKIEIEECAPPRPEASLFSSAEQRRQRLISLTQNSLRRPRCGVLLIRRAALLAPSSSSSPLANIRETSRDAWAEAAFADAVRLRRERCRDQRCGAGSRSPPPLLRCSSRQRRIETFISKPRPISIVSTLLPP